MSGFTGDGDFLDLIRQRQEADEELASTILETAEEEFGKSLEETEIEGGEEPVEKGSPWTDAVEGTFGQGISVYKHKDGSSFWVTKGNAVAGWVERRGRKWLARPVGRDEWTGDDFKSAVSHIVGVGAKDDTNPPPGTK